jgi:2-oxo-4-hydroxy-4-carboxy-5-ureidoimidazoline decarboxylase
VSLAHFYAMSDGEARRALELCCVSSRWIDGMLAARPFASPEEARRRADDVWRSLQRGDVLEAFEGHPKIGDVDSLKARYADSGGLAAAEQAGVAGADDATIARLARGNRDYAARFGFIFIVCASGKSAAQMCRLLEERLHHDPDTELRIAAEEQRKILRLRLEKLL